MKHILFFLIIGLLNISYSQSGWIHQNSGISTSINSIKFVNSNTGWCAGDNGKILSTTNGGINWNEQMLNLSFDLNSISLVSSLSLYCVGDSGVIYKTTNGGQNWLLINRLKNVNLKTSFFINENTGFTSGIKISLVINDTNKLYKTTNGGLSWDSTDFYDYTYSIFFLNANTGWSTGVSGFFPNSYINKTTDMAANWNLQLTINPTIKDIFFIDSLYGWMGSPKVLASFFVANNYRSTDGGINWIACSLFTGDDINSIFFANRLQGWAAGSSIKYSNNGGVTWSDQILGKFGIFYNSIYFTDSLNGWTVGDSGTILRTTTGGVLTSFTNQSTEIPDKYFLSQNYPNPFNPGTIISYSIPVNVKSERSTSQGGSKVKLIVYDILGNEVVTLVNERKNAGSYNVKFDGSNLSSGIYIYKLSTENFSETKRMMLIK